MLCYDNLLNGKIYIIKSLNTTNVYIGSTCLTLATRLSLHKSKYKAYLNGKGCYLSSFKILECGNAYIELLEEIQCINNQLLLQKEGEYMNKINNVVNKNKAGVFVNSKDYKKDYNKNYYINNKDYLSSKIECECGGRYRRDCKYKHFHTNKHENYINSNQNIINTIDQMHIIDKMDIIECQ
jgi:hypothetical protein